MANFFIYIDKAYRSEIALFRAEGVQRDECEMVEMPAGTRQIYRVGELSFFESMADAARAFLASPANDPMRTIQVCN